MKFVNYHFKDYINKGLASIGFIEATKIQDEVIPRLLKWESVIGKSETGSGKTQGVILPSRFAEAQLPFPAENIHDEYRQAVHLLLLTADARQLPGLPSSQLGGHVGAYASALHCKYPPFISVECGVITVVQFFFC